MARTYKAKPDQLGKAIKEILTDYGDNVTEGVKEATKRVAKIAAQEVSFSIIRAFPSPGWAVVFGFKGQSL